MSSPTAYAIRRHTQASSEKSDIELAVRSVLVRRGSSLRQWAHAWAMRTGREPSRAYQTARNTLGRRLAHGLAPNGTEGQAFAAALRADLGAHIVPLPRDTDGPARRRPATTRR